MNNLCYYILSLDYYPYDAVFNNKYKTDLLAYQTYMLHLLGKPVSHDTYTEMEYYHDALGDSTIRAWRTYNKSGRCVLVKYGDYELQNCYKICPDKYVLVYNGFESGIVSLKVG